jgi:N-acetylglucosaminyldiphosphoundecaprenol N-acetyl-beta-D-mannosaminyltransferase
MPLIWASQLARTGRLHRITGSSLIYTLSEAAAHHKKSIYILGGPEGAAELAGQRLQELYPGLKVVGAEGPWLSSAVTDDELEPLIQRLEDAAPDIVFCGFGFPKQEKVVAACRARLPNAWFLGCGAAVNFAAGYERRAPLWMQRTGLEWAHRLISEPRRLFRRYVFDAIFAARLLVTSAWVGAVGVRSVGIPSETIVLPDVAAARTQLTETTVDAVAIEPPGAVVAFAMAEHI